VNRIVTTAILLMLSCSLTRAEGADVRARLLRTVQLGAPQGITAEQIAAIVQDPSTSYLSQILGRSALLVLGRDNPQWGPFENLLSSALNTKLTSGNEYPQPSDLHAGFGGKELVFTMVYAMVMAGQQERAVSILDPHLWLGSRYNQAVVLQALRNIGTPRAVGLIQNYQEKGDYHNLAENTLVDQDLPVLFELHDRWNLVPPAARTRSNLLKLVQNGCGEPEAMAAYWLGCFPPDPDSLQQRAELSALKSLYQGDNAKCDYMARLIAIKSLGLRSQESEEYWADLLRRESDIQVRHQILTNAFAHDARRFANAALDLLASETSQYIQWELMQGNIATREGQRFRSYWDIWIPVTLQFLLVFPDPGHQETMSTADQSHILHWFETGHRPRDRVVLNHLIYCLLSQTRGENTRRLLAIFNDLPDRNKNWWILVPVEDPSALPLLDYYGTLPAPKDQHDELVIGMERLRRGGGAEKLPTCCESTRACLRSMLGQDSIHPVTIRSEQSARAWLKGTLVAKTVYEINLSGALQRSATIHRLGSPDQHWEYLYDCWRRTDAAASPQ
jgi:hypothetical protein